jgi:GlcNAc-P-P-Und epimerase
MYLFSKTNNSRKYIILKYLISGANGFIGSFLKNSLIANGNSVKTLGKAKNNNYSLDLTKEFLILPEDFDVIIHSASIVHDSEHATTFNPQTILQDIDITLNFLRSIEKVSFKKLIFLSSVSVYGIDFGRDIDITQKISPKSGYGLSKVISEKIITKSIPQDKLLILRLPLVNGPNPKGNIKKALNAIKSGKMVLFNGNKAKKTVLELEDLYSFLVNESEQYNGIHQLKSYDIRFNTFIESLSKNRVYFLPLMFLKLTLFATKIFNLKSINVFLLKTYSDLTFIDTTKIK